MTAHDGLADVAGAPGELLDLIRAGEDANLRAILAVPPVDWSAVLAASRATEDAAIRAALDYDPDAEVRRLLVLLPDVEAAEDVRLAELLALADEEPARLRALLEDLDAAEAAWLRELRTHLDDRAAGESPVL